MNKKIIKLLLVSLFTLPLLSCGGDQNLPSIDEDIKIAINSLRGVSHKVHIDSMVELLKPNDTFAVDLHDEYTLTLGYYYNDEEKSFSKKTEYLFNDLDKLTGEIIEGRTRRFSDPEKIYFKDNEDGTTYVEKISFENEYSRLIVADYNSNTGGYTPIIFDNEFKNPFDYISYRDVIKNEDNTLSFINEKADFLADCYDVVGLNKIDENYIHLNESGEIASISFVINDLVETNYTRKNALAISFEKDESISLKHLSPYQNNNPELQKALDVLDDKKNYTYSKEMSYEYKNASTGEMESFYDLVKGYFTEEMVFFHHETSENDTHPYIKGDNYDYKLVLNEDNKSYTCYEYVYSYGINGYDWKKVALSGSAYYIIDDFKGIGPSFYNMNASIFKKIDDKTYEIEEPLLATSGIYFDNGCQGVQSRALDGNTSKCIIKLNESNEIDVIQVGFTYQMVEYNINFYIDDVGTTSIPSWVNDITYLE